MNKKKILFVYYSMVVGGSTTSLLSVLNCLDREKYDIDVLLYKNEGSMLSFIPKDINILSEASIQCSKCKKQFKFISSKYFFKSIFAKLSIGKLGISNQVLCDFQVKKLSRKVTKQYDIAVGFIEGWADRYVANIVQAKTKIGWLHSDFTKIAEIQSLEISWMKQIDKIVTVAQKCKDDFSVLLPQFASKTVFYENIMDSKIVKERSLFEENNDKDFIEFKSNNLFKIITVCRLDISSKGLDRAIKCANKLKLNGAKFIWLVVGEGEDHNSLENLICKYDLKDCFHLIGNRFNPYSYIKLADIYCMPSRWEGKPIAVTESMILGVPPIVTEYLSAKEQIENEIDGFIVPNGEDTIYDKVKYCIDNPKCIAKMRSQLLLREYGNASYIKKLEEELFI